jgi:hypothetical protein
MTVLFFFCSINVPLSVQSHSAMYTNLYLLGLLIMSFYMVLLCTRYSRLGPGSALAVPFLDIYFRYIITSFYILVLFVHNGCNYV